MLDKIIKKLEKKTIIINNKPITVKGTSINWLIIVGSFSIAIHFIAPVIILNLGIYFRSIDMIDWIRKIDAIILFREILADYPIYTEIATSKMAIAEFEKTLIEAGASSDTIQCWMTFAKNYLKVDHSHLNGLDAKIQWMPLNDENSLTILYNKAQYGWEQTMSFHWNEFGAFKIHPEFLLNCSNSWFYYACWILLLMITIVFLQLFLLDEILLIFVSLDLIFTILATLFAITGLISNDEVGIIFFL